MPQSPPRPLTWIGSSRRDLKAMPAGVKEVVGYALYLAQTGGKHDQARPLQGFGSAGVLEVIEDDDGGTYRAVYTVRYRSSVYVLHCFQKKSRKGIATPQREIELIKSRLKHAQEIEQEASHEKI